jgi:uncharacterized protein (TIGR03086 family)
MSDIAERYERLAAAFADTVAAVPADGWENPSPCEGWTARDVVRHVTESQGRFMSLVGRDIGDVPSVDDDPVAAWQAASRAVLADLNDPERATAGYDGRFGRSTFERSVDGFASFDLVVHRWDLARAAGLDDRIPPEDVRWASERAAALGEAMRGASAIGPAVDPPADADEQTRLLAHLGRRAFPT